MENSELSEKKDKQVLKNGTDFDILCRDETFWQQTVKDLAGRTEILSDVSVNKSGTRLAFFMIWAHFRSISRWHNILNECFASIASAANV